jgi:hypothetical protein
MGATPGVVGVGDLPVSNGEPCKGRGFLSDPRPLGTASGVATGGELRACGQPFRATSSRLRGRRRQQHIAVAST